ncbi:hypothetical protein ACJIZ3_021292 [Penstemon smallii]|uniref:PRA1 family protein n=1 Tax=Penstemon smallii TaxID=265156 RepID=A0ABD3SL65_9LAMI
MNTTYGTIPTPPPSSDPAFLSNARDRIRSSIRTRRPWKEMVSFSFPGSFNVAHQRIKTNASYFHVNYVIIVLFVLFLSLLWHPVSLIVFLVTMTAWLFLYFLRDDPIMIFGYGVDKRVILVFLSIFTFVLLLMTHALVFIAGVVVGLVVVVVHGAFRRTNDLVFDEGERIESGLRVDLKETASASYSSSF